MNNFNIYILSSRDLIASPAWASIFEFEDLLAEWCDAEILCPKAKPAYRFTRLHNGTSATIVSKFGRLTGNFHQILDLKLSSQKQNILFLMDLSPDLLKKVTSISNWREKFDLVVGYVEDCCILESYPDYVNQFDTLFIPYEEYQAQLERFLSVPVKVIPYAFDVLNHGVGIGRRCIDVASYGRTPQNYYFALCNNFNSEQQSDNFYYHSSALATDHFPKISYCNKRSDYLHRAQLKKTLQHSKLVLAFDFNYTVSEAALNLSKKHPSYRFDGAIIPRRWFESTGVGSAIVGKKPKSGMMKTLFDWEDSTIELPDDASEGVAFIQELLQDQERLNNIHYRNHLKSLELNDWRLRVRDMFKILGVTLPDGVTQELEKLDNKIQSLKIHQNYTCHSSI